MKIGVLALHGGFAEHQQVLQKLGHESVLVRSVEDLQGMTHLILPGGESTVMAKMMKETGIDTQIIKKVTDGSLAVFGTCAGAILLSKKASGKNAPESLSLIDIEIDRNAYGTQTQSFRTKVDVTGINQSIEAAFIRAPIITKVGDDVNILASHDGNPVIVQSGRILASTCHPEVCGETALHQAFLKLT